MILAVQLRLDKHTSEFLDRTYQAYRKHTLADPEVPENVRMVNVTFIGQMPQISERNSSI